MTNYHDKFTQITAQLAAALRSKADAIPFTYTPIGESYPVTYNLRDRQARIDVIGRIAADYIAEHAEFNQRALDRWYESGAKGERPSPVSVDTALLDRLADAVLNEELTDTDSAKVTREEYPFLSETQLARRRDGAHVRGGGGFRGEMSLSAAGKLGADGRNYRDPTRRWRTPEECIWLDRNVKSRNRERAEQYRKDTAPGRIVRYSLRETGGELAPEFAACQGVGERWANELSAIYT